MNPFSILGRGGAMTDGPNHDTAPGWDAGPSVGTPPINPTGKMYDDWLKARGLPNPVQGQAFGTASMPPQQVDGYIPSPGDLGLPDVYEDLDPVHAALKDQIALKAKKGNRLLGYFTGENLEKTVQEIGDEQDILAGDTYASMMAGRAQQDAAAAQQKAMSGIDQMFEQLVGMAKALPRPPTRGNPEMPNAMQAAAGLLAGLLTPEHAFDAASVPFFHSLNEREMRFQESQQQWQAEMMVQQTLMELAQERGKTINQFNMADWQAAEQRVVDAQKSIMDDENDQRASLRKMQEQEHQGEITARLKEFEHGLNMEKDAASEVMKRESESIKTLYGVLTNPNLSLSERSQAAGTIRAKGLPAPNPATESPQYLKQIADAAISEIDLYLKQTYGEAEAQADLKGKEVTNALRLKDLQWYDQKVVEQFSNNQERLRLAQAAGARAEESAARTRLGDDIKYLEGEKKALDAELKQLDGAAKAAKGLDAVSVRAGQTQRRLQIAQEKAAIDSEIKEIRGLMAGRSTSGGASNLGEDLVGKINYKWGGKSEESGLDCSGFTCLVAKRNGVSIPAGSRDQFDKLPAVPEVDIEDGDFVYFKSSASPSGWHTGVIFFKGDEPWVRHASGNKPGTKNDIIESPLSNWKDSQIRGYRRFRGYKGAR